MLKLQSKWWSVMAAGAVLAVLPLTLRADLVAHYLFNETSGPVHDSTDKPADSTNALKDAKDYSAGAVPPGKYGDLTVTPEISKTLTSIHIPAGAGFDLGSAEKSKLNLTGNFTVMAWVKFSTTDGYHIIFATGAGSGSGWKIGETEGSFLITANGVADQTLEGTDISADTWYHLAITVSGTKDTRTITFYVNGKKANADALSVDDVKESDAKQMHIGSAENADDTPENLDGSLADLRIYNTVLSEAEIKQAAVSGKN